MVECLQGATKFVVVTYQIAEYKRELVRNFKYNHCVKDAKESGLKAGYKWVETQRLSKHSDRMSRSFRMQG
jgi:hypothetical protein